MRRLLERLPLEHNADDIIFDNQMLTQILWCGNRVAEVSCPTRYFPAESSISFWGSARHGCGSLATAVTCRLAGLGVAASQRVPLPFKGVADAP